MSQKTVFISYRRDATGKAFARNLKQELTHRGYDVFLDVDCIDAGQWEAQILARIPKSAHFLLLLTPGALDRCVEEGDWLRREFLLAHRHRRNIVPVAEESVDIGAMRSAADGSVQSIFACQIATIRHATFDADLETLTTRYIAPYHAPAETALPTTTASIDISRILKYAPEKLIGREAELAQLDNAWSHAVNGENSRPRILTFVALGGEGKTSLVAKWAADLAQNGWPGADAVYAWSFYSQGSKDQSAASGDLFLREALRVFGDPEMAESPAGAHEKGQRLARLVGAKRALLILDGLEPLQFPPGSQTDGVLKDQGVSALLKGLAANNAGLCLVTTRYSVDDLKAFRDGAAPEIELKRLSREAGIALLGELGVTGSRQEFAELVEDVQGHALTLNIMGRFLQRAYHGDIRQRDRVDFQKADARTHNSHAFRAMAAYETWLLADGGEEGQREVAILRLLGLFDRPADAGCLAALRGEVIPNLSEALADLAEDDWEFCLTGLEAAHLLTVNHAPDGNLISLDAHPLLREYFAAQLREQQPDAWRAAHRRIYEHLCATTKEGDRPSLEALQPLYQAIAHGCWAGMQQEACEKVYKGRILRGNKFYSPRILGAFASDLGAVACFFDAPWRRLAPGLSESAQAWLFNEAATRLRALGRLSEALEPIWAGTEMVVKKEDWEHAAAGASNLSELEVTLGALGEAQADGVRAVTYADRSGEWQMNVTARSIHADALHQAGHAEDAAALFREAEVMQTQAQPAYRFLYSSVGFRYGDFLLAPAERAAWRVFLPSPIPPRSLRSSGHLARTEGAGGGTGGEGRSDTANSTDNEAPLTACAAVTQRATQTIKIAERNNWLLDIALDHFTLGRAALYAALLGNTAPAATCRDNLEAAVAGMRRAGTSHMLPFALLSRAWLHAIEGRHVGPASAQADLDEAEEIAARGPMPLFRADIALHRARLFATASDYPWDSPAADLKTARELIEKHGYERRREEMEDAEAWLATLPHSA